MDVDNLVNTYLKNPPECMKMVVDELNLIGNLIQTYTGIEIFNVSDLKPDKNKQDSQQFANVLPGTLSYIQEEEQSENTPASGKSCTHGSYISESLFANCNFQQSV